MTKQRARTDYWHDPAAPPPTSRKPSASVAVRDQRGRLLLLHRSDNALWTIPTGAVKRGETVAQAAERECREETGIHVQIVGLVGIFSDPGHIIVYAKRGKVTEVRQPINICLHARPGGGELHPAPDEATEVRWVQPGDLADYDIHPAIRLRIHHALEGSAPVIA